MGDAGPARRVDLRVPKELAEWPWELATLEKLGPPAVHPKLTVVRVSELGSPSLTPPAQLVIDLIGVHHDDPHPWEPLKTRQEIERIRQEIEAAGKRGRYAVTVDARGGWDALVQRYEETGPPHLFHFAGHGFDGGRGLVFAGEDGGPEEITAEQVAMVLRQSVRGRQTRLAFLNACSSSATGKPRPYQPFGALGAMLIQHGVPMVIGLQTALDDSEAQSLAAAFYQGVANGDSVDCAIQRARRDLYLDGGGSVSWAFVHLTVSGTPSPLWRQPGYTAAGAPSASLWSFAHREQRQQLDLYLGRRDPLVVVIGGEVHAGHRYVAERLRFDLGRAGSSLYYPVAVMRWFSPGEKQLSRTLLAGGIARALDLDDEGTREGLEKRIARKIADCCEEGKVLVIDLEELLQPADPVEADAVVELVQELWTSLMNLARRGDRLPVFLLLSIAWPQELAPSDRRAARARENRQKIQATVERLRGKPRLEGRVRVEVLKELRPIEEPEVADFLEQVLEIDPDAAEAQARSIVDVGDNETILARMTKVLEEWEEG
ncbi:MAG: CHAT domain-containing protein [Myxococcales bacterium]|nr:CHAT domain-containing protein [Myxococcales bacterium]